MTQKEKIIRLYLTGKYNSKTKISTFLNINKRYVDSVIKEFNKTTTINTDYGICQSFSSHTKFYLFSSCGIEKTLILFDKGFYSEVELSNSEKNFIEQNTGYKVYESKKSLLQLFRE